MRWLADENIPRAMIICLRELGGDVAAIAEIAPGVSDREVMSLARTDRRILLSFDRDHGDLIYGRGVAPPPGVIYLRVDPPELARLQQIARVLVELGADSLHGFFTVISRDAIRKRPLPAHPS